MTYHINVILNLDYSPQYVCHAYARPSSPQLENCPLSMLTYSSRKQSTDRSVQTGEAPLPHALV